VIVSIEKRFPKHAQESHERHLGARACLSLSKLIVVVDSDCDVHDYAEVAWRAFGNVDYAHGRAAHDRPGGPFWDHASYEQFFGGKLGVDATRKLPTEGYRRDGWLGPRKRCWTPATSATVERRWA